MLGTVSNTASDISSKIGQVVGPVSFLATPNSGQVDKYSSDAVSVDYIESALIPEVKAVRQPVEFDQKTALAASKFSIPLKVNANGSMGVYVFANQATVDNPAWDMAGSFISILNDVTFDSVTGAQTPIPTPILGPLVPATASILSIKCTGFALSFIAT